MRQQTQEQHPPQAQPTLPERCIHDHAALATLPARSPHPLCPWWVGYLLASPLRRLLENPGTMLAPHLRPGMTVLDPGCGMGFFSLDAARMVGPTGRVICVDVQERMIRTLAKRARRRGLDRIVETRVCSQTTLDIDDLAGRVDFVLAIHVVHETHSQKRFLRECMTAMRSGARLLMTEPKGHVSLAEFVQSLHVARAVGLVELEYCSSGRNPVALLEKPIAAT